MLLRPHWMFIQADVIRIILHGAVSLGFISSDIFRKFEFARQNLLPRAAMQSPFDIIFIWSKCSVLCFSSVLWPCFKRRKVRIEMTNMLNTEYFCLITPCFGSFWLFICYSSEWITLPGCAIQRTWSKRAAWIGFCWWDFCGCFLFVSKQFLNVNAWTYFCSSSNQVCSDKTYYSLNNEEITFFEHEKTELENFEDLLVDKNTVFLMWPVF